MASDDTVGPLSANLGRKPVAANYSRSNRQASTTIPHRRLVSAKIQFCGVRMCKLMRIANVVISVSVCLSACNKTAPDPSSGKQLDEALPKAVITASASAANTSCIEVPAESERFETKEILDKAAFNQRLPSLKNSALVWQRLKQNFCRDESFSLYSHKNSQTQILIAHCHAKIQLDNETSGVDLPDQEYPMVFIIRNNMASAFENFQEFGFMYETGQLNYITDINRDGNPEFWLEGDVSECDGEGVCSSPCDYRGSKIVEISDGLGKEIEPNRRP